MVAGYALMEMDCNPYDGFYSGGHIMPPLVMDRAGISSGGYEKSASHYESAGCLGDFIVGDGGYRFGPESVRSPF